MRARVGVRANRNEMGKKKTGRREKVYFTGSRKNPGCVFGCSAGVGRGRVVLRFPRERRAGRLPSGDG